MAINYEEKRDFKRMSVECDISYTLEGGSEKFYGKGSDLSATGVMFTTDQPLAKGARLDLSVHPYIKTVLPLQARATVIRSEKQAEGYLIGVKLEQVK